MMSQLKIGVTIENARNQAPVSLRGATAYLEIIWRSVISQTMEYSLR